MPYDVLKTNGWDMQLYGGYRKPIRPFHWAYQPGLESAYKAVNAPKLPFAFSYHWRGGTSNAMIARRGAAQAHTQEVVGSTASTASLSR
jgi:outer membrane autotransporter protein